MVRSKKKSKGGHGRKLNKKVSKTIRDNTDLFEVSDSDGEDVAKKQRRSLDSEDEEVAKGVEYELPSDFSDEEIDEDFAFNDEDEEKYGQFFAKKEKGSKKVGTQFDIHKEQPEGVVFLSDLLNDSDDEKSNEKTKKVNYFGESDDDDDDDESDEMSESDDDDSDDEEEDDDDNDKHKSLLDLVDKVASKSERNKSKKKERTEVQAEGEYNASKVDPKKKLTLDQMMNTLNDESSSNFGELKKKLSKLNKAKEIGAPVARVVEERAERKAGYEKAKEAVHEWNDKVMSNRQAKTLSFPLNAPGKHNLTTAAISAKFKAKTDLELEIQNALEQSGLAEEKAIRKNEELELAELNNVDIEQIKKRRGDLSKLRALMFYDEQKAKRAKKIKSKMYRKLKKRRLAREEEKHLEELRRIDPKAAKEIEDEAALKRAHERMTLKHKNTSKFIRGLLKHGGTHRDRTKEAIVDQLKQGEELTMKMNTMEDEGDEELSSEEEDNAFSVKKNLRKHANNLLKEVNDDKANFENKSKKGLMGLKFMQRGVEKKRQKAEDQAKALLAAIDNDGESEDDSNTAPLGRRSFKPKTKSKESETREEDTKDEKNDDAVDVNHSINKQNVSTSSGHVKASNKFSVPSFSVVKEATETSQNKKQGSDDVKSHSENPWLMAQQKVSKRAATTRSKANEIKVNLDGALAKKNNKKESKKDDVLAENPEEKRKKAEQSELLRRAFVNAGVVQKDFDDEMDEIEGKGKSSEPAELVGWGSWAGAGVEKPKPKRKRQQDTKINVRPTKKNRKRVIVSAKRNKKFSKYLVDKVPYPFTSREQYERSLANPLGSDWNTMEGFKDVIKPAVITKSGAIIEPLSKGKSSVTEAR